MKLHKFLLAAAAVLTMVLMLAPGAGAQGHYKTLIAAGDGRHGSSPDGSLIFDSSGNLYGTTLLGGNYSNHCYFGSCGTVFQLTPNPNGRWPWTLSYDFHGADGDAPTTGVIFDAAGNLYGMTNRGGDYSLGAVFELTPEPGGGWTESVLHSFSGPEGTYPGGNLIFDASGNLYGTTGWGCGMGCVFEMMPNPDGSWTESVIYGFACCGGESGGYPVASLVFDSAGNLYGTTAFGGLPGCSPYGNGCYGMGVAFELSPNGDGTWTEKVLHHFTGGKDGATPTSALVFDSAGNLYGTTYWGGAYNGNGNVFRLKPNGDGTWTEQVLHQFTGGKDGGAPVAGVIFDGAGNLYGTATQGGAYGYGVVFRLRPRESGGVDYDVLHAFRDTRGDPGALPLNVVLDAAGNLYGITMGDGTTTFGTVFEITP